MGDRNNTANLDSVIQFRVTADRKRELEESAARIGLSVGEMMRRMTETVEVLFDTELRVSDLIFSIPLLQEIIRSRKDRED